MRLSPSQPYNNDSYAELLIFDGFRNIEMPEAICFNSLHLVSHSYKRMSEIDFTLVCSQGVFVFEVKGGRVFQSEGKWYSRSNQKNHLIQNPFNQSRNALFSLIDSLKSKKLISVKVPVGYGALFPDTISLDDSIEYDPSMYGNRQVLKGFSSWLHRFIKYWVDKVESPYCLDTSEILAIANYLRPGSIFKQARKSNVCHLNAIQKQVVTAFENDKRIICEGAAGTGKTHLIKLIAQRCIHPETKLLVLCESNWLKRRLKTILDGLNTVVATIDSLKIESQRTFITQYDVVIVDGAQEIYQVQKINLLESYIKGGFNNGKWLFFEDLTNKSESFTQPEMLMIEKIKGFCNVHLRLEVAYRYSNPILSSLTNSLDSDSVSTKKVNSPDIEVFSSITKQDEKEKLEIILLKAIKSGYRYADITIISTNSFLESVVSFLPERILNNIIQIDDFNVKSFPLNGVTFSEINHFNGLENKVIILVDFSKQSLDNPSQTYMALTRASEHLFILWTAGEEQKCINNYSRAELDLLDDILELL